MARRKTHDEFVKEVYDLVGDEYSVLGRYSRSSDKILMKHNLCGHEWLITPNNFLNHNKRCPKCAKLKSFKTTETFRKEVDELYNGIIEVLGDYIDCDTYIKLRCKKHNHTFERQPTTVLRGRRICKYCNAEYLSEVQRKSEKGFQAELKEKHNGKIISLEKYINTHTRIWFKCLKCNEEFKTEPNAVLRVSGCPSCAESKGESEIRGYLISKGVDFDFQKTFPDCKRDRPLAFDFYVPSYNLLIEYDGKQHFEPIEFFGGEEGFKDQIERDRIKNNYAKNKGINLIRVPYWVRGKDIVKVLDDYFKNMKLREGK